MFSAALIPGKVAQPEWGAGVGDRSPAEPRRKSADRYASSGGWEGGVGGGSLLLELL